MAHTAICRRLALCEQRPLKGHGTFVPVDASLSLGSLLPSPHVMTFVYSPLLPFPVVMSCYTRGPDGCDADLERGAVA